MYSRQKQWFNHCFFFANSSAILLYGMYPSPVSAIFHIAVQSLHVNLPFLKLKFLDPQLHSIALQPSPPEDKSTTEI